MAPRIDWSEWGKLVGVISDPELSDRSGITVSAVTSRRRRLGIPSACEAGWVDWLELVGKISDKELSERSGIRVPAIASCRKRGKSRIASFVAYLKPQHQDERGWQLVGKAAGWVMEITEAQWRVIGIKP